MQEKIHPILQVVLLVAAVVFLGVYHKYETPHLALPLVGIVVAAISTSFAFWINPCPEKCRPCPPCAPCGPKSQSQAASVEADSEEQWASCQSSFHVTSPSLTSGTSTVILPKLMPSPCAVPPITATPVQVQKDICSTSSLSQFHTPEPVTVSAVILFRRMCAMEFLHLKSEFWCLADTQNQEEDLSAKESALRFVLEAAKLNPKNVVLHPTFSKTVNFLTGEKVTKKVTYFAAEVNPCAKVKVSHKWLSFKESLRVSTKSCSQLSGVLSDIANLKGDPAFKPLCIRKSPEPWFAHKKGKVLSQMVKRADKLVLKDSRYKRKWTIDNSKICHEEHDCFCPHLEPRRMSNWVWILTCVVFLVAMIAVAAALLYFLYPKWLKI